MSVNSPDDKAKNGESQQWNDPCHRGRESTRLQRTELNLQFVLDKKADDVVLRDSVGHDGLRDRAVFACDRQSFVLNLERSHFATFAEGEKLR